jgi:hypothetical protein
VDARPLVGTIQLITAPSCIRSISISVQLHLSAQVRYSFGHLGELGMHPTSVHTDRWRDGPDYSPATPSRECLSTPLVFVPWIARQAHTTHLGVSPALEAALERLLRRHAVHAMTA